MFKLISDSSSVWSDKQRNLLVKWGGAAGEVKGVYELSKLARQDPTEIPAFLGRMNILEKYYSKWESLGEELYELNSTVNDGSEAASVFTLFPDTKQENVMKNVRTYYLDSFENRAKLEKSQLSQTSISAPPALANVTLSGEPNLSSALPKLSIPRFDGSFLSWTSFIDSFTSIVHKNPALTATQKFHYLVSSLSGVPKSVISSFSISEANYEPALQALRTQFENKRIIASMHLNRILNFKFPSGRLSHEAFQSFFSSVSDSIQAIKLLGVPDEAEFLYFSLAARALDPHTRQQFEYTLGAQDFPTVDQLTEFIRKRQLATHRSEQAGSIKAEDLKNASSGPSRSKKAVGTGKSLMTQPNTSSCLHCKGEHSMFKCKIFLKFTPRERLNSLKEWSGCKICLSPLHKTSACTSKNPVCKKCKSGRHNSLLCLASEASLSAAAPAAENSTNTTMLGTTLESIQSSDREVQVILGTAMVSILDHLNNPVKVRIVIDSASQYSYITQRCVNRLGLRYEKSPRRISCLGGIAYEGSKGITKCQILNPITEKPMSAEAIVVKEITSYLPSSTLPKKLQATFAKYNLADRKFFCPARVDFLLAADLFPLILNGPVQQVGENLPHLLSTIFGQVVIGKYTLPHTGSEPAVTSLFTLGHDEPPLDLEKFWETEEVCDPTNGSAAQEIEDPAEKSFVQSHSRDPEGRFVLRLPFKEDVPDLRKSEVIAKRRFHHLEAKLLKNPTLQAQYSQFMRDYSELFHMSETNSDSRYVVPHHGVTKEDRNQIKLRVVFDASLNPTGQGSLNDHLHTGPALQRDIRSVLLNFRAHLIVFVADIVKMYRQIRISDQDLAYQHIFWRSDPNQRLKKFELKTLTYGMNCAPFLALRCLKQLETELDSKFSRAKQILRRDIYVDDIVTGADCISEALQAQQEIIQALKRGGFELSKWASNEVALLDAVQKPSENHASSVHLDLTDSCKILGLRWEPALDVFSYHIDPPSTSLVTKRGILSAVARIYDPTGFLSPVTILFKILVQKLWLAQAKWDDPAVDEIVRIFTRLVTELPQLIEIKIPRHVANSKPFSYQLVGFCDSSEVAYAACLYLRVVKNDEISVKLLTGRTKVAPTKKLSLPRLELSGALLLCRLIRSVDSFLQTLDSEHLPTVCFTDSSITLAWIQIPAHQLKVFVGNRVKEIKEIVPAESWRHVAGGDNPADCASRGVYPSQLLNHPLWWSGPDWLQLPHELWPKSVVSYSGSIPETKQVEGNKEISLISCSSLPHLVDWMSRFSDFRKLIRVTARILRLVYNRKHRDAPRSGEFLLLEVHEAFLCCVKVTQEYHFFKNSSRKLATVEAEYRSLSPFQDIHGLIRVGGRLANAPIAESHKHPLLLPRQSHFALLLVRFYHKSYLHASPGLVAALIQKRVWIPHLRRLVNTVTRQCVFCFSKRASAIIPHMGDLPWCRVNGIRAFNHVGTDFAGPLMMRSSLLRKAVSTKVYICVFVCMSTKALHLELVSDLTSAAFLAAFTRFVSRRGLPHTVYSDNAGNFVGAARELREVYTWINNKATQDEILRQTTNQGVDFQFNPPYSPHFGGLWESAVRSIKTLLRSSIGETPLTFEELQTYLCRVEAALNSRPLTPTSQSPDDLSFLSPGHFLIGDALLAPPEKSVLETKINYNKRWLLVQRAQQLIWKRFYNEYLSTLQKRVKWTESRPDLEVGDLVMIRTADPQPLHWPTGRVKQLCPGKDGHTRVVILKTATGECKRSTANLIPLTPINHPDQINQELALEAAD